METKEQSPETEVRMVALFTLSIIDALLPKDFRLTAIKTYTGTSIPNVRMIKYKAAMVIIEANDAKMCKVFLSTLDGIAYD